MGCGRVLFVLDSYSLCKSTCKNAHVRLDPHASVSVHKSCFPCVFLTASATSQPLWSAFAHSDLAYAVLPLIMRILLPQEPYYCTAIFVFSCALGIGVDDSMHVLALLSRSCSHKF